MSAVRSGTWRGAAGLVALVVLAPYLVGQDAYYLSVMTSIAMFTVPAMGAWLLMQTGLFSFGQAGFGSLGAYAIAILLERTGIPIGFAALLAVLFATLIGALLAFPFLRARSTAFAVLTLVSLLAIDQVIVLTPDLTGAGAGLVTVPLPLLTIAGQTLDLASPLGSFYLIAAIMVICMGIARLVASGPRLLALRGIAQDEQLAASVGIKVTRMRAMAFVWAASFSAAAGAFSAPYLQVAHPRVWGVFPSIFIVAYAIIGGRNSIVGPLLGAAAVIGGTAIVGGDQYQSIFLGVGLIVVVLFLPDGLAGGVGTLVRSLRDRLRELGARGSAQRSGDAA